MDVLDRIRTKINDFPGYGSEADLAKSDGELRAYVGVRLAELRDRLSAEGSDTENALQPLIVRAAFANQRALAPLEWSRASVEGSGLLEADAALIDLADAACTVTAAQLDGFAARVSAAFDARDASLINAGVTSG